MAEPYYNSLDPDGVLSGREPTARDKAIGKLREQFNTKTPRGRTAPPKGFAAPQEQGPAFSDPVTSGAEPVSRQGFLDKMKGLKPGAEPLPENDVQLGKVSPGLGKPTYEGTVAQDDFIKGLGAKPDVGSKAPPTVEPATPEALPEHPHISKLKAFSGAIGEVLRKFGVSPAALGKITPVVTALSTFIPNEPLAAGTMADGKGPEEVGEFYKSLGMQPTDQKTDEAGIKNPASDEAANPVDDWWSKPVGNPIDTFSEQVLGHKPAEKPTEAPKPDEATAAAPNAPVPPSEAPSPNAPQEPTAATPSFIAQPDKAKEAPPAARMAAKASPKAAAQDKPLLDDAIVAWNAKNNSSFKPDAGTASFQGKDGKVSPSGLLFMGNGVYMSDPSQPDGYRLVYNYGEK